MIAPYPPGTLSDRWAPWPDLSLTRHPKRPIAGRRVGERAGVTCIQAIS